MYIFRSAQISVSKSVVASNFFNAKTANCAVFLSNAFPLYRANYQRRRQISSTTTLKPRITTIFYLPIIFVKKSTAFHQWDTFIYLTVQSERKVRDFRGSNNYVRYRTRSTYFDDKWLKVATYFHWLKVGRTNLGFGQAASRSTIVAILRE